MKLQKDGNVINLSNPDHIAAFVSEGWTEYEEQVADDEKSATSTSKKRKTTTRK